MSAAGNDTNTGISKGYRLTQGGEDLYNPCQMTENQPRRVIEGYCGDTCLPADILINKHKK